MKFLCVWLFVASTTFALLNANISKDKSEEEDDLAKWKLNGKTCYVTPEQWKIISWYMLRVGHISVTQVTRATNRRRSSKIGNIFIRDLYKHTEVVYRTYRLDYSYQNEQYDIDTFSSEEKASYTDSKIYKWHSDLYKPPENESEARIHSVEDDILKIRSRLSIKNQTRSDEPDFGNIVLAQNIELLDHYLNGVTRHPFDSKRAYYVIVVYLPLEEKTWLNQASSVLAKMWKYHGILNAIIFSTCKNNNIGYYDPFVNVGSLNITGVDEWGIFRYFPLKLFDFSDDWIVRKDVSLNQFPLTISMFDRYPTMVPAEDIPPYFAKTHYARGMKYSNYGGIDGILLGNLAEAMDFKVNYITPSFAKYGNKLANGTFTGALGDTMYGRADAAFNGRFLLQYGSSEFEFLLPVLGDRVCVIAPSAAKIPQWTAIFRCFDFYVWITFVLMTFVCGVFWFLITVCRVNRKKEQKHRLFWTRNQKCEKYIQNFFKFTDVLITIWKVMLGANARMPQATMERLFIASCLVTNIIIVGTFEGSLYTAYSKTLYYKDIDTLSELDSSGLAIATSSQSLKYTFGNNETASDILKSLKSKLKFFGDIEKNAIMRAAENRDICSLERESDVAIIIQTKHQHSDGSPKLHVIKECPRHYFLSYIARKGWPWLQRCNGIIRRFGEGGFVSEWYRQMENAFILNSYIKHPAKPIALRKPFSLSDIQTPFYVLIVGYAISFVVFLIEKFVLPPKRKTKIEIANVAYNKEVAQAKLLFNEKTRLKRMNQGKLILT